MECGNVLFEFDAREWDKYLSFGRVCHICKLVDMQDVGLMCTCIMHVNTLIHVCCTWRNDRARFSRSVLVENLL